MRTKINYVVRDCMRIEMVYGDKSSSGTTLSSLEVMSVQI